MLHNNSEKISVSFRISDYVLFSVPCMKKITGMYESKYNPPFMVRDDGPNSPLDHQRVISKLTFELGLLYYQQKRITLEPLPESP